MLLAELSPMDIRQLFICHKEAFYRAYLAWSDAKKSFVADFLGREYQIDKAGARTTLFGPEPGMEEPDAPLPEAPARDTLVERVGPWGAVTRR